MRFPDDVPQLTDGVVTLRAHTMADADAIVEQCTDPQSIAFTKVPVPYTREHAVERVTRGAPGLWADRSELVFAVEAEHADGVRRFAGSVGLRPRPEDVAEIAFGLHPGVRGRGLAGRAVRLLLDWGFTECGFAVVYWTANVGNWASRRVAWATGFTFHGTVDAFGEQRGERRDMWFATLRPDEPRTPKGPWFETPVIESPTLRLRGFTEADTARLDELMSDPRGRHFNGRNSPARRMDAAARLTQIGEAMSEGRRYDWCIADPTDDRLLGHMQLFWHGLDPTSGELGYGVHPDSRGRGVLTEALRMLPGWAFRPLGDNGGGLRRLTLGTAESNTASRYAAERAGFTLSCVDPDGYPIGETGFEGMAVYALRNPDWADDWPLTGPLA